TSNALVPGSVMVAIGPFDFAGDYSLTNALLNMSACGSTTFSIEEDDELHTISISGRVYSCGQTTVTFEGIGPPTVEGGRIKLGNNDIGERTDSSISVRQSTFISGCGQVNASFTLTRTLSGFTYADNASAACTGPETATASVAYQPTAELQI